MVGCRRGRDISDCNFTCPIYNHPIKDVRNKTLLTDIYMDIARDIQKTDGISNVFDNKNVRINPFGENRVADRTYRRVERIAAAIYLLTNHIESADRLRVLSRSLATDMLDDVIAMRDEMRSQRSPHYIRFLSTVRREISVVRLMYMAGYISTQNMQAIVGALDELAAFVSVAYKTSMADAVSLSQEDLMDTTATVANIVGDEYRTSARSVASSGAASISMQESHPLSAASIAVEAPPVASAPSIASVSHKVGARASNIIETLKVGGSLGIKDICLQLPEYSEKMVQRELLALVLSGRVRKEGEKRWSRYSLV